MPKFLLCSSLTTRVAGDEDKYKVSQRDIFVVTR